MKTLQPVNDNVLLKIIESDEEKTSGGLYIPDTAKEKTYDGEVVALSPELETTISVGDTVLYKKYSGTEAQFDGIDYIILPVDDILAIIVDVEAV